jgi:hypothetical protein
VHQPELGSAEFRVAPCGNQSGQRVVWTRAGVVDVDQHPPWYGPDPRGHRGAAVQPGVADRLRHADLQILEDSVGHLTVADAGDRAPGLDGRRIGQLEGGDQSFEGIGIRSQWLEIRRVLVQAAVSKLARRQHYAGVGPPGDIQDAGRGGGGVVQAPAPHGEPVPDRVGGGFVAVPSGEPATVALVRHVAGDPYLGGTRGRAQLEYLPVRRDCSSWRSVQVGAGEEGNGGWVMKPRPQQAGLAVVIADDDRLAAG